MKIEQLIILFSIAFQAAAAVLAIRLIRVSSNASAWLLVAAGITLMTIRRIESLIMQMTGGATRQSEVIFELVGLAISILLCAGIYRIKPIFLSIMQAQRERETLIADLQEALAKIKTLGGMLPICASCKKIRDDKGYWKQIEVYVHEHSEAEFSHGICPDCAQRLYPEFYKTSKKKDIS